MLKRDEAEKLIEQTMRDHLGPMVGQVDGRFADDQRGEPAIFVDTCLKDKIPYEEGRFPRLIRAVMEVLEAQGDNRFPYLALKPLNDTYPPGVVVQPRARHG